MIKSEWDEETFFKIFNLDKFPKLNLDYEGYLDFKEEALKVIDEQRQALLQKVREIVSGLKKKHLNEGVNCEDNERETALSDLLSAITKLKKEI